MSYTLWHNRAMRIAVVSRFSDFPHQIHDASNETPTDLHDTQTFNRLDTPWVLFVWHTMTRLGTCLHSWTVHDGLAADIQRIHKKVHYKEHYK